MAVDAFLKIDGIDGESKDHKHADEIELESYSCGLSQIGTSGHGTGAGGGKANFQDFHFVMKLNKASPKLFLACATGEHIGKAVFVQRKAGGSAQEFLKWTFTDILVSSYQTGGHTGGDIPMDQISLNFSKMEYEYQQQDEKGAVGKLQKVGYDLKLNKKV
jgi:type VI secretion system secreted protein Hcp